MPAGSRQSKPVWTKTPFRTQKKYLVFFVRSNLFYLSGRACFCLFGRACFFCPVGFFLSGRLSAQLACTKLNRCAHLAAGMYGEYYGKKTVFELGADAPGSNTVFYTLIKTVLLTQEYNLVTHTVSRDSVAGHTYVLPLAYLGFAYIFLISFHL